jgi:hypothetical protein
MIGFEDAISVNVVGFASNFSDQYCPFPDDQNAQKRIHIFQVCFHGKLNGRSYIGVDHEIL